MLGPSDVQIEKVQSSISPLDRRFSSQLALCF